MTIAVLQDPGLMSSLASFCWMNCQKSKDTFKCHKRLKQLQEITFDSSGSLDIFPEQWFDNLTRLTVPNIVADEFSVTCLVIYTIMI